MTIFFNFYSLVVLSFLCRSQSTNKIIKMLTSEIIGFLKRILFGPTSQNLHLVLQPVVSYQKDSLTTIVINTR